MTSPFDYFHYKCDLFQYWERIDANHKSVTITESFNYVDHEGYQYSSGWEIEVEKRVGRQRSPNETTCTELEFQQARWRMLKYINKEVENAE